MRSGLHQIYVTQISSQNDPARPALLQAAAQLPTEAFQVALQCLKSGEGHVDEAALDLMSCLMTGPGGVHPSM